MAVFAVTRNGQCKLSNEATLKSIYICKYVSAALIEQLEIRLDAVINFIISIAHLKTVDREELCLTDCNISAGAVDSTWLTSLLCEC
jgi:hypothetical protein